MTRDIGAVEVVQQDKSHHFHPFTNPVALVENGPDMVTHADGIHLHLSDGRRVIDSASALWNVSIGYGNERVCAAAFEAMKKLSFGHVALSRSNPWVAALSAKLAEITPEQYRHFFFAATGSEAVESSIKMALHYWRLQGRPQKRIVISRRRSFHGNTLFAASLTGLDVYHNQFGLPIGNVLHTESTYWYRDGKGRSKDEYFRHIVAELERQIIEAGPENIAALIGEPIQTGMVVPTEEYWPRIRELCDRYEILLIADEIVSGFGRTGRMFGFQNFGFEPDLFVVAKGITSGYFPVSAVGIGEKVAGAVLKSNQIFAHIFTNCGHPVGAAVALENLAVIEELGLVNKVRDETGPYLSKRMQELMEFPCVGEVRAIGVMGAFEIDASGGARTTSQPENDALLSDITSIVWRRGAIVRAGALCMPMVSTKQQIDEVIDILKASIEEAWGKLRAAA